MSICRRLTVILAFGSVSSSGFAMAQSGAGAAKVAEAPVPAPVNPLAQLSADQRQIYSSAARQFSVGHYADALAGFKRLMGELPAGATRVFIAKAAAEAALNAEDFSFAKTALLPLAETDANDWQTAGLLARFYAGTGDAKARDAELAHIVELHKHAPSPQITQMRQILLERISIPNGSLRIWYSLEPSGPNKTHLYCRVDNAAGAEVIHITLESPDRDQALFAQQHPDMAAAGGRRFSLNVYGVGELQPDGDRQHTHTVYSLFDGEPSYDVVRQQMIEIAGGKGPATAKDEKQQSGK